MCLALMGKVKEIKGKRAVVEMYGRRRDVSAEFLMPEVGDKVMIFNDFIIEKV